MKKTIGVVCLICVLVIAGCKPKNVATTSPTEIQVSVVPTESTIVETNIATPIVEALMPEEVEILSIPLPENLAAGRAEVSGMAWYGDKLVLLPQYPDRFSVNGAGSLFYIQKADLVAYLDTSKDTPIDVVQISFDDGGVSDTIPGFEGFESIVFYEDNFYVTVESGSRSSMVGYVYRGLISDGFSRLSIEPDIYQKIEPQADFNNASEESILVFGDQVYTFYEDYGKDKNLELVAHVLDLSLNEVTTISMPNLEYRLTDVSQPDAQGYFWGINYFFPGDVHLLPASDPIADKYGEGETHASYEPVERLVQFQITSDGIILIDRQPIQFMLLEDNEARNWEGLVALDDLGFLVITDKFPTTILGFCKNLR